MSSARWNRRPLWILLGLGILASPGRPVNAAAEITGVEGAPVSEVVARYNVGDAKPRTLDATINWGDGSRSAGAVAAAGAGQVSITGTHTYAEAGTYAIYVVLTGPKGLVRRSGNAASITDAPLTAAGRQIGDPEQVGPNQLYLDQLYQDLFGRLPDEDGLNNWLGLLDAGIARNFVTESLAASTEFRTNRVDLYYSRLLRRPIDGLELNAGVALLAGGGTMEQVQARILGSPEYLQAQGGGSVRGFLHALYRDVLGRPLDPTGGDYFAKLIRKGQSRTAVAMTVLTSGEAAAHRISAYFMQLLRRAPSGTELHLYVQALLSGARDEELIGTLLATQEYFGASVGGYHGHILLFATFRDANSFSTADDFSASISSTTGGSLPGIATVLPNMFQSGFVVLGTVPVALPGPSRASIVGPQPAEVFTVTITDREGSIASVNAAIYGS